MSKRSQIAIVALAGFSAMTLAGCKEDQQKAPAQAFDSLASCQAEAAKPNSWWTETECQDAFAEAEKVHASSAPRYDAQAVCEEQHGAGQCMTQQASGGGGSIWMPALAGYFIGSMMSGGKASHYSTAQPLYSSRSGGYVAPNNLRFGSNKGAYSVTPKQMTPAKTTVGKPPITKASLAKAKAPMTKTTVSNRGGFGAGKTTSSFRSSFGG